MSTLTFVAPPPGLAPQVEFELTDVEGAHGLATMTGDAGVRLFLVDAAMHLPDYTPTLAREHADRLGVARPEDAHVFVVANPAADATTVNLMAPVVVHSGSGAAMQVILDDQDWPLQHPLGAPVSRS